MQVPTIRLGGDPQIDGAVTRYVSEDLIGKAWYNPTRPVIFVNGMLNDGAGHREAAERLSLTIGSEVVGVFNKTAGTGIGGALTDLWQCITDKARLASAQTPDQKVLLQLGLPGNDFSRKTALVEEAYQLEKARQPGLSKDDYVYGLLGDNPATRSLYALLVGRPGGMLGTPIHAHSQGNLITSNALTGVALARGIGAISGLVVVSYGSPAQGWPPGLQRTNNAFTFDGVGWLDATMDWSSAKVGYKLSHGNPFIHKFRYYADYDAEFFVNKFRTGGWGMTVNMDEKGLAQACADLGNHTDRLFNIFTRLKQQHWTDSDDVALEYVKLKSDRELAEIGRLHSGLARLLIELLEAGWTSGEERKAIERVQAAMAVA